jgi:acyl carrier protein
MAQTINEEWLSTTPVSHVNIHEVLDAFDVLVKSKSNGIFTLCHFDREKTKRHPFLHVFLNAEDGEKNDQPIEPVESIANTPKYQDASIASFKNENFKIQTQLASSIEVKRCLARILDIPESKFKSSVSLAELGVDSLLSMQIAFQLQESFGYQDGVETTMTVEDLVFRVSQGRSKEYSVNSFKSDKVDSESETVGPPHETGIAEIGLIKSFFAQILGVEVEQLRMEQTLAEIGVDSLLSMQISFELQEKFGFREVVDGSMTLGVLINKIQSSLPIVQESNVSQQTSQKTAKNSASSTSSAELYQGSSQTVSNLPKKDSKSIKMFLAQILDVGTEQLRMEQTLAEIGVDSLLSMQISFELQEKFDFKEAVDPSITLDDLIKRVLLTTSSENRQITITPASSGFDKDISLSNSFNTFSNSFEKSVNIAKGYTFNHESANLTSARVKNVIATVLGANASDIHNSSSLVQLGIDSLLSMQLAYELQEHFGFQKVVDNSWTVGHLAEMISKQYQYSNPPADVISTMHAAEREREVN